MPTQPTANFAQAWYPDSGASHHATSNPENLLQSAQVNGNEHVLMENGQGMKITRVGSNMFQSPFSPNTLLQLQNLLLVPALSKNLLSVSKFTKDNSVFFEFHPSHYYVKC
jgi:histone deacetylase 1/2